MYSCILRRRIAVVTRTLLISCSKRTTVCCRSGRSAATLAMRLSRFRNIVGIIFILCTARRAQFIGVRVCVRAGGGAFMFKDVYTNVFVSPRTHAPTGDGVSTVLCMGTHADSTGDCPSQLASRASVGSCIEPSARACCEGAGSSACMFKKAHSSVFMHVHARTYTNQMCFDSGARRHAR